MGYGWGSSGLKFAKFQLDFLSLSHLVFPNL